MQSAILLAGGDVEWSRMIIRTPIVRDFEGLDASNPWLPLPRVRRHIPSSDIYCFRNESDAHAAEALRFRLPRRTPTENADYPFRGIRDLFRKADIGFVNLEMPLSDRGRQIGQFRGQPGFARALSSAGIDIVSLANNHVMDAEGIGLSDTIHALSKAGIRTVGAGKDLSHSRAPVIVRTKGIAFGFLAYSQLIGDSGNCFALSGRSGVAPLDPYLVKQDICNLRRRVDLVVVSFHWGIESEASVHPRARRLAREAIDRGADLILGHHSHVPQAVETYRKGLIVYSLGNLIFGHAHRYWGDNILVRAEVSREGIQTLDLIPIAGQGKALSQPSILGGTRALRLLKALRRQSRKLGTNVDIHGDVGRVSCHISPKTRRQAA